MALNGIAHKDLTDPQLHEVKGASTAEAWQVPVADGEGHTRFLAVRIPSRIVQITAQEVSGASSNTTTNPTLLGVTGLSATTTGSCEDASDFTDTNKNIKELAVKLNELINYAQALKASYNDLVTNYNNLQEKLETLGLISIEE